MEFVAARSPGLPSMRLDRRRKGNLRTVLLVEALEERTLLNNRFVVPVTITSDNATTFHTLQAALTTAGLAAGDVIQIEPGATPGTTATADLPLLADLTTQGNPAAGTSEIPAFTVTDSVTITAAQAGFTLKNVQVHLDGGGVTFNANGTITGSILTNNFAGTALT